MIEKQKSPSALERAEAGGEYGTQPLDRLMAEHDLSNTDVVQTASAGVLTHKMLNKARRGRRLSRKVQEKVLQAFNQAVNQRPVAGDEAEAKKLYAFGDLFNYDGR